MTAGSQWMAQQLAAQQGYVPPQNYAPPPGMPQNYAPVPVGHPNAYAGHPPAVPYPQPAPYVPQAYVQVPQVPQQYVPQQPVYQPYPGQYAPAYPGQMPVQQFGPAPVIRSHADIAPAIQAGGWVGEGNKTERTPCPKCGSMHFFSKTNEVRRGPAPAPQCMTCGYNGLFEQGDAAAWQSAAA